MSSRTLSLAAVALWICAIGPVSAQNLEAGKTPAQIFAATCAVCHKGPHGLLKTVAPGSLPGFLRQHYTTSTSMAGAMSAYVLSNGAANRRAGDDLTHEGRETRKPREPEQKQEQEREKPAHGRSAKPKDEGAAERSADTDAKGKKPKADRRKPKHVPAKDEPKDTSKPKPDTAPESKPEAPAAESNKPAVAPEKPSESKPAATDNAPDSSAKKPDEDKPASNMPVFNVEPKPDAKPEPKSEEAPAAPPPAPAPEKPAEPRAPAGAPSVPLSQ
jgi:hypothetical protein